MIALRTCTSRQTYLIHGHFAKAINNDPERFYTEDIMHRLDIAAGVEYKYGGHSNEVEEVEEMINAEN